MAERGLGRLSQKKCDAIATRDADRDEVVGETVGLGSKLTEAEIEHRARVIDETQRQAFRTRGRPLVAYVLGNVVILGDRP